MDVPQEFLSWVDPSWSGWIAPPIPPAHAPGSHKKMQVVWPRDKKQGGAHTWGRFWDVLSGKGPDMWVKRQGSIGPTKPEWSRWDEGPTLGPYSNLRYWDNRDHQVPPWPLGHAAEQKQYDFNTRRYEVPHFGTWSDVKWDRNGRHPLYVRDRWGVHHMHPDLDQDYNQFVYNPRTNWWNWNSDTLPWDFPAAYR